MSSQKDFITLNRTGQKMPLVGFGTARIPSEETEQVIYNAIKTGYRLLDCALFYGNEAQVGKGIQKALSEGIVKREDLFVISKLWNNHHHKDSVKKAIDVTLKDLGLDYIDLYLVHWPMPNIYMDPSEPKKITQNEFVLERSPMHECWHAVEDLVDQGLVRNIGVSNFNVQLILDMFTYCKYKPAILEIEHHPYLQQKRLINWAASQEIHTIAYASFGPSVYNGDVPNSVKHLQSFFEHPVIKKIAEKHNHGAGEILLKWSVQRGIVVIPKSVNVSRMKTNLDLFSFELDQDDLKEISDLDCNARFNDFVEEIFTFELPIFE
ncbi:NAD(P)H-dependent D-xylose reductase (XR) [Rhizopus stolonifer]|uniref:NAD(P)H-dependent D-xylose reductase (XR) n=1 Tax=Rhizopus stolonifer TaxID=4846 RepID=A0A367KJX6_RHIST|nr:NAD(P)H-dependent D-xylose reductase (XR) [Rhizopus stolonifer]